MAEGKLLDDMTEDDFRGWPVWRGYHDDEDYRRMAPVERLPVEVTEDDMVATDLALANGFRVFGALGGLYGWDHSGDSIPNSWRSGSRARRPTSGSSSRGLTTGASTSASMGGAETSR